VKEIKIEIFHAINQPELWQEYTNGHASVLQHFGVKNLKSFKTSICTHPEEYVITARNSDGALLGGIRIQNHHIQHKLPVVDALDGLDPKVNAIIEADIHKGISELCGLWVARDHGRLGLAHYLIRAAIAYCPIIHGHIIYGISSPFAINIFLSLGYIIMKDVGDNGTYLYPTPEFTSTMVVVPNTNTIEFAEEEHRKIMFALRMQPKQTIVHFHKNHECTVFYDLTMKN
jgi:hypothetical protein